jgi:hypothetical protein
MNPVVPPRRSPRIARLQAEQPQPRRSARLATLREDPSIFVTEYHYDRNDFPRSVEVRFGFRVPQEDYDEEEFTNLAAEELRNGITTILQRSGFNWTSDQIQERVRGLMELHHRNGLAPPFFEPEQPFRINRITGPALLTMFTRWHQSNLSFRLFDIVFVYEFIQTTRWGAGKPKVPSWLDSNCKYLPTWKEQEYRGQPLNCGAFAIEFSLATRKQRLDPIRHAAQQLMHQNGWSQQTTIHDLLMGFITSYPFHR